MNWIQRRIQIKRLWVVLHAISSLNFLTRDSKTSVQRHSHHLHRRTNGDGEGTKLDFEELHAWQACARNEESKIQARSERGISPLLTRGSILAVCKQTPQMTRLINPHNLLSKAKGCSRQFIGNFNCEWITWHCFSFNYCRKRGNAENADDGYNRYLTITRWQSIDFSHSYFFPSFCNARVWSLLTIQARVYCHSKDVYSKLMALHLFPKPLEGPAL